jgi:hypothetical protein
MADETDKKPDDQTTDQKPKGDAQGVPDSMTNQTAQQSPAPEPNKDEPKPDAKPGDTTAGDPPKQDDTKPKEDEQKPEDKPLDVNVWGDTGSDTGNAVLKKLQETGIKPETAKALLYDAVQLGDPTKIDKTALVAAVGEASAQIVLSGIDTFVKENNAKNASVLGVLHEQVGGEENWNVLRDWAKTNLNAEEIQDYIDMIDAGGRKAVLAAKDLNERYEQAGNTSLKKSTQVVPQANNQQQQSTTVALSSSEYFKACEKAQKDGTYNTVRASLLAGRELGKKQGK